MKKFTFLLILLFPTLVLASDITSSSKYLINESIADSKIKDNKENTYISINNNSKITISNEEDIYGIYIIYEMSSKPGIISNGNKSNDIGEDGFLHEYVDVLNKIGPSKEINLTYNETVKIADIYVIGSGDIPEYVEIWKKPCDEADLLLFSTHSDDEQLFFLGLLPTYVAKGASVQVVYFAHHNDNPQRLHEQLHGLYTVGIRNYPITGLIPDAYSESLNGAINNLNKANLTVDDATNFEVEMIRRFKPLVVVGHDEKGEYSHGQHILNTHVLKIALEKTNDPTYHVESYEKYGLWDTPKTYLHLYKKNEIIMDYDIPLEYFDGKTAYEVSKEGYSKHNSQQWTWFTRWINGSNNEFTKATDIKTYSPLEFGLYRSTVGEDISKNDMFENLIFRKDEVKEDDKKENETNDNSILNIVNQNKINLDFKTIVIDGCILIVLLIIYLYSKKKKTKK